MFITNPDFPPPPRLFKGIIFKIHKFSGLKTLRPHGNPALPKAKIGNVKTDR